MKNSKNKASVKNVTASKVTTPVKEINLNFYQIDGIKVETKFSLSEDAKTSLLIGTAINELFTLQSNYRNAGISLFKSSKPVLFTVSSEEMELLNIGSCSKVITDKLKFNKTSKSMRTFAKRVNLAVTEITRKVKLVSYEDLLLTVETAINSVNE